MNVISGLWYIGLTMTNYEHPGEPYVGGEWMGADVIDLKPKQQRTVHALIAERPKLNAVEAGEEFIGAVGFEERYGHLRVVDDIIGLRRRLMDGTVETYRDKLTRAERSGKQESARFGTGTIMGERAVVYAMDWGFFAGSLGEAAGEKFVLASELAMRENLPFVSFMASSGVRQQENVPALVQMERMAVAARKFQHTTDKPYVSVLAGQVWGGMSASAVPIADLVVALEGTDYGFAGPRVIETFEGSPVPKGAQSAEANLLDRNIDVTVKDVPELLDLLGRSLRAVRLSKKAASIADTDSNGRQFPTLTGRPLMFNGNGFSPALYDRQHGDSVFIARDRRDKPTMPLPDQLMARYREIAIAPGRIDTEFVMQNVFDNMVPFYNTVELDGTKTYPNIIAGVGSIGEQSVMVIGDQPSYTHSNSYVGKKAANPGPEDFEFALRMLQAAERWRLPVMFVTDTLGALPTMAAERRGQSRAIAELIGAAGSYPYPLVSVITGGLGSGGGLATTPFGRHTVMLDSGLGFVSEPRSMASILYNVANPTDEQVKETLESSRSSAEDLKNQGLVDAIVHDSDNPYQTAHDIRAQLVTGLERQHGKKPRELRADTAKRLSTRMLGKLAQQ